MYTRQNRSWKLLISDDLSVSEATRLFTMVHEGDYQKTKSLKEHHRSLVLRICLLDRDLVLKVPSEKNNRKWIRFLTWFRMGEAFKNITGMQKLLDKSIPGSVPLLAAEKRSWGMVTDSWLLYYYLDGENCLDREKYYPDVVKTLNQMHSHKILHGDPQIRNFIAVNNIIHVIDSNPKWVGITSFDKAYEWAYLKRSAPGIERYFGAINNWWSYKLAYRYDTYERKFARSKRKVKTAIKSIFFISRSR